MSKTTQVVRDQYERLPYPPRNPDDELSQLRFSSLDELGALNLYCFRGRRDFRDSFRVLVAGGGTGDATIHLAHQLRDTNAEIFHLDLSAESIHVARERAKRRGLRERVTWMRQSLLELPGSGFEPFDYINCSGVLHHLEDPQAGLRALRSVLKDDGAMGLMLYGQYGRTGVYQMQSLLRLLNRDDAGERARLDVAKSLLQGLPPTNWFRRAADQFSVTESPEDAEVYDLFLHAQDRAFTVPQLYKLIEAENLHFVEYGYEKRALYDPNYAFRESQVRECVRSLPPREQQAAAELYWGCIAKHTFWVSTQENCRIDLDDADNVPFWSRLANMSNVPASIIRHDGQPWTMGIGLAEGMKIRLALQVIPAVRLFAELVNDRRTMGEIVAAIVAEATSTTSVEEVWTACRSVIDTLLKSDLLLLRHESASSVCVD